MTSSNGNIFRVTDHLCGEFTGHRWNPRTKASDADLWCFLRLNKRFSKRSWVWWFETPSRPSWRHCNAFFQDVYFCIPFNQEMCTRFALCYILYWGVLYQKQVSSAWIRGYIPQKTLECNYSSIPRYLLLVQNPYCGQVPRDFTHIFQDFFQGARQWSIYKESGSINHANH